MEDRPRRMVTRSKVLKVQKDRPSTNRPLTTRTNKKAKSARPEKIEVKDGARINTRGLPMLPDELLLEIMSFLPPKSDLLSMELTDPRDLAQDASDYAAKRDTLMALTQTCRNLRRFFRPYIWSRIEVHHGIRVGEAVSAVWNRGSTSANIGRMLNAELVRQLEIVTVRDPSLAKSVKFLNVEVRDYSIPTVLAELARCMTLFPNLHSVKLDISSSKPMAVKLVGEAFSSYLYPQVHLALVSGWGIRFLRRCPSLRLANFVGHGIRESTDYALAGQLMGACPRLENLKVSIGAMESLGHEFMQAFRHLRIVDLDFHSFNHDLTKSRCSAR
ncbi:hypothetical protein GALMADRAFT_1165011 [Galerina marginata CBS 339.88]|uniref:Uncharacterized protein n=1 Tax=Galerina marginata (strain CBS 339.88) TaxID=685588 RepID=A0A067T9C9_GALM3|nr:hypothetical protein GALMADRAFT_1165011 [Galerina marginata CBS 339.88]